MLTPSNPYGQLCKESTEEDSLAETQGAISFLWAVTPQRDPENPFHYLQRPIPNIWMTSSPLTSSNTQHLCKAGRAASFLELRSHPHHWVMHLLCLKRLYFPFILTVKMTRSSVCLFNKSWVSHKHKKQGFIKASLHIAGVMQETHDLARLQLYTGIFRFKKSGLQKTVY